MKLNDIKFLPKANAFSDVYSKATGVPFVGEMMVAAAGNGKTNPFNNVVLNITEKDGEGNGNYVLTFNGDTDAEMSFTLYGENDFMLETGGFEANISVKHNTLFYDSDYQEITDFPNGGTYEVVITGTEETYRGKWTLNDATENCENTEFPTVEDIQIEETEDGWVGRITFDRDIRTYGDFLFDINNSTINSNFYLESDLLDVTDFDYLGNNTFQVNDLTIDNPQSGELNDFVVDMYIGKFNECKSVEEGLTGTVTRLPIWYVVYADAEGTVETSRGTGELTGVIEDGYQETTTLSNNNYPQLVGQHLWISEDAAVDDGDIWPIYIKYEGQFVPYDNLYTKFSSEEPETPNAEK